MKILMSVHCKMNNFVNTHPLSFSLSGFFSKKLKEGVLMITSKELKSTAKQALKGKPYQCILVIHH